MRDLRRLAEGTPPQRDRYVDLLRAVAIAAVVVGHWLIVVVTYDTGGLDGYSALEVLRWSHPLTWLFQVMPLFFLVGGYANGASLAAHRQRGGDVTTWLLVRGRRLLGPTTVFVVTVATAALAARLLGVDPGRVATAVWLASVPLWFLAAYVAVVVLAPALHRAHQRAGWAVVWVLVAAVAVADAARLLLGLPHVGDVNYLLAWLAIHQVGFAWRDEALPAGPRAAGAVAAGGLVALVLLTAVGPYPVSMVAVPGEHVQNTAPPTLALLALAATQTGLALLLRPHADRWLRASRPWLAVVAVNSVVLTVFLWHMTAVVLAAVALYPSGLMPQPAAGTPAWLLLRLPWLAFLSLVLAVLVAVFGPAERRGARWHAVAAGRDGAGPRAGVRRVLTFAGLAMVLAGLAGIATAGLGDHGPTGLPPWALAAYLLGVSALRFASRQQVGTPR